MIVLDLPHWEKSLVARGRSRVTAKKYAALLAEFHDSQSGQGALADQLADWITRSRECGQAAATIRLKLAAARSYSKWRGEPMGEYKAPPLPPASPHPLPGGIADVERMLAMESGAGRAAVALGALAGLRVQESISVTRDSVRIINGRKFLVVKGKGDKVRNVPVSSRLNLELELMPYSGRLVPLSNSGARAAITRIARKAKVTGHDGEDVSSHDLRATFASAVYEKTKDIRLVQILLGHASILTTQVYIKIKDDAAALGVEF